jgi:peroxiredoxin
MSKRILSLILAVAFLMIAFSCKTNSGTDDQNDQAAQPVPGVYLDNIALSFIENDQNGNSFTLESRKGRVILLVFSAMWCSPCRSEASKLMELYNTYKERGLEVIQCIYQDEDSDPADLSDIKRWVEEFKIGFTVVNDPDYSSVNTYNFNAIPFNVIIDRDFIIRYRTSGFNEQAVKNVIEDYL